MPFDAGIHHPETDLFGRFVREAALYSPRHPQGPPGCAAYPHENFGGAHGVVAQLLGRHPRMAVAKKTLSDREVPGFPLY